MAKWWQEQKMDVVRAVHEAEQATGHQIVVHVGNLGRSPAKKADKLANKWPGASLVICIDPKHRHFEIRWAASVRIDPDQPASVITEPLRNQNIAGAIGALAALLPVQQPGEELPDVIDES